MPYFRVSGDPNDLTLLPKSRRDHDDLDAIAARAETAVLTHLTKDRYHSEAVVLDQGEDTERYVYLRGYAEDPNAAATATATALRMAIANVIRWQIARAEKPANVTGESGEKRSKAYRPDAEEDLPMGWDAPLLPFRIASAPLYL